ncbi:MAG: hypothetical protein CIT03_09480, partial [Methanobacterium sp.]
NFNSTIGTINSSDSTKKGKSEIKLTSTQAGTANVSVTLDNQTVSKLVNITSVNVLGVYNTRTQESFISIRDAIDDADTRDGDSLTISEGIYTENVVVNKKLTIKAAAGAKVTVKAKDDDKSVFVIGNGGSGSTIQGFNIISSSDSYGISLSHSYNNNISNNNVSDSNRGIYLYNSGNNTISGITIKDSYYGIFIYNSASNNIFGNIIKNNENGIYLRNSNYNIVTGNTIVDNFFGSYVYHSNNNNVTGNIITGNWAGIYLYDTNNNYVTNNNLTDNGAGITHYNSIGIVISGNNFSDNWITDISVIDSGKVVMATSFYTCGPAALATILKNMGIYTTEIELAELAGTDETGTSLFGLTTAALNKGVTAIGARLTTDQLKSNHMVVLSIKGVNHFVVIQNITDTTVYLFDPNLGNVEMTMDKFNELYIGIALIINEQAPANATLLTDTEMENIKGFRWEKVANEYWIPGFYYPTLQWVNRIIYYPVIKFRWVPGYRLFGRIPIPGHFKPYIKLEKLIIPVPKIVWKWKPPEKRTYYTYKRVPDIPVYFSYVPNLDRTSKKIAYGGATIFMGAVGVVFGPNPAYRIGGAGMIYSGLYNYQQHLDEVGYGDDWRYTDPLFYI